MAGISELRDGDHLVVIGRRADDPDSRATWDQARAALSITLRGGR